MSWGTSWDSRSTTATAPGSSTGARSAASSNAPSGTAAAPSGPTWISPSACNPPCKTAPPPDSRPRHPGPPPPDGAAGRPGASSCGLRARLGFVEQDPRRGAEEISGGEDLEISEADQLLKSLKRLFDAAAESRRRVLRDHLPASRRGQDRQEIPAAAVQQQPEHPAPASVAHA